MGFGGTSGLGEKVTLDGDDGDGAGLQNGGTDEFDTGVVDYYFETLKLRLDGFFQPCRVLSGTECSVPGGGTYDLVFRLDSLSRSVAFTEIYEDTWVASGAIIEYRFTPFSVPEPSIIALFAAGLFGLGLVRRRKAA